MENSILKIRSSWHYKENDISIIKASILENELYDKEENANCADDKLELTPLVFCRPEKDEENCEISFFCDSCNKVMIKRFTILSDTRTLEVFHKTDGYLFCVRGSIAQTYDEEKLFKCSLKLDFLSSEVYLKFPVKPDVNSIKVFQVKLDIQISEEDVSENILGQSSIDLEKVKSYLGEIPESAKGLFKNMEAYQKNQQSMKSSVLAGGSFGSFGMMGLMSALMGGMHSATKTSVNNSIPEAKTHTSCVTQNGPIETKAVDHRPSSQQPNENKLNSDQSNKNRSSDDHSTENAYRLNDDQSNENKSNDDQSNGNRLNDDQSSDSGVERESMSPDIMPKSDFFKQLMYTAPATGMQNNEMYTMLKNICGSVSGSRAAANKDSSKVNQGTTPSVQQNMVDYRTEIQESVEDQIQRTEDRLKNYIDQKLTDLEDRLNEKLDRILICLSNSDNTKPP